MKKMFILFFVFLPGLLRAAEENEKSIEEFLQELSTIPNINGRRDPFLELAPPYEIQKIVSQDLAASDAPPLERYPADQYSVVAVLIGDQYPRALVKIPGLGHVVIVKEKDKLGLKQGVITKIKKDGITVIQNQRNPRGFIDKVEVFLPLGGMKPGASGGVK